MGTYRVQVCRRVWETATIEIGDADSPNDAVALAEQHLDGIDEDELDWSISGIDAHAEIEGVVESEPATDQAIASS
jgi:hypothetical protein